MSYAWLRDTKAIAGANGSTYTVSSADVSHHLQCRVSATNAGGSAERDKLVRDRARRRPRSDLGDPGRDSARGGRLGERAADMLGAGRGELHDHAAPDRG